MAILSVVTMQTWVSRCGMPDVAMAARTWHADDRRWSRRSIRRPRTKSMLGFGLYCATSRRAGKLFQLSRTQVDRFWANPFVRTMTLFVVTISRDVPAGRMQVSMYRLSVEPNAAPTLTMSSFYGVVELPTLMAGVISYRVNYYSLRLISTLFLLINKRPN